MPALQIIFYCTSKCHNDKNTVNPLTDLDCWSLFACILINCNITLSSRFKAYQTRQNLQFQDGNNSIKGEFSLTFQSWSSTPMTLKTVVFLSHQSMPHDIWAIKWKSAVDGTCSQLYLCKSVIVPFISVDFIWHN